MKRFVVCLLVLTMMIISSCSADCRSTTVDKNHTADKECGADSTSASTQKAGTGYRYQMLYKNDNEPLSDEVQAYIDEIIIDLIYTDRTRKTFFGNEKNRDDLLSEARRHCKDRIFWGLFAIDVDNDGQEEFFDRKILHNGGSDMTETTVTWYDPEINQVYATPFDIWEPAHYYLTQQ